ncbi:MAG: 6-bladed beta-propeller [Actinomycetota bacterium]|nr:6-bladed beta-propeller [Actinomycetota bacterium]
MKRFCVLLLLIASACTAGKAEIDYSLSQGIIWPGPPEKPRIEYLWSMARVNQGFVIAPSPGQWSVISSPQAGDSGLLVSPRGVFVDSKDNLYVADPGAGRVDMVDLKTMKSDFFTSAGSDRMVYPLSVAGGSGKIYVTDPDLRKVFALDEKGAYLFDFKAGFLRPTGLAVDQARGLVYVVDTWANDVCVFDLSGRLLRKIGHRGAGNGEFNFPTFAAVGRGGTLYVADTGNFRVQMFGPDGSFKGAFGVIGDDFRDFERIKGIAVSRQGYIFVADAGQDMIKIFDKKGRLMMFFGQQGSYYGQFTLPSGICVDGQNRIFVSDSLNARIQAFKFLGGK